MKPKQILLALVLLAATTVSAQTILKGDMNNDEQVTIADVTSLVNVILGKAPQETISAGGSPYMVDNTSVVGIWYAPDGTSFVLNEDGTTDYGTGYTYKFRPYQGTLMMFDASGAPVKTFVLNEVEKTYLLAVDYSTGTYTYYTNIESLVSDIQLNEYELTMNSGTTHQLLATILPTDAFNRNVKWMSADESVATVDQNGLVTAVAGGQTIIVAETVDGSNRWATCDVTVIQMVTSIELSETHLALEIDDTMTPSAKKITSTSGSSTTLTATVQPGNAVNRDVEWSSSNENVATVTSDGVVTAVGRGTCVVVCASQDGSGMKARCTVGVHCESDYVDLGLPSGTLWATCNVGASSPEDYGDYFAWGETEGYNSGKTDFSWSTYKWCEGTQKSFTKYCNDSEYGYNGYTDNLTELELEDDAAYVNWGPGWRIPSREQLTELDKNTNKVETTQNGVRGLLISSRSNENAIFMPYSESRSGESLFQPVDPSYSDGFYMGRTCEDVPFCVLIMYLNQKTSIGGGHVANTWRYCGLSVRPVRTTE